MGENASTTVGRREEGSSRFSSRSLVFDLRKDVDLFDETTIGRTTTEAERRRSFSERRSLAKFRPERERRIAVGWRLTDRRSILNMGVRGNFE